MTAVCAVEGLIDYLGGCINHSSAFGAETVQEGESSNVATFA